MGGFRESVRVCAPREEVQARSTEGAFPTLTVLAAPAIRSLPTAVLPVKPILRPASLAIISEPEGEEERDSDEQNGGER